MNASLNGFYNQEFSCEKFGTHREEKKSKHRSANDFISNLLYFRIMRRLESGILSKSIHSFTIDFAYRALISAVALPFVAVGLSVKAISKTIFGKILRGIAYCLVVFAIFSIVGGIIMGVIYIADKGMLWLDATLGEAKSLWVVLCFSSLVVSSLCYVLIMKPENKRRYSDYDTDDEYNYNVDYSTSLASSTSSRKVTYIKKADGTYISVTTRCA